MELRSEREEVFIFRPYLIAKAANAIFKQIDGGKSMYLKESSSNSSMRLSAMITCAFRRYIGRLLVKFRRDSKCAKIIDSPKSTAFDSHCPMQMVDSDEAEPGWFKSGIIDNKFEIIVAILTLVKRYNNWVILCNISGTVRSLSRIYGKTCGTVVFGATGFVQLFMFFHCGLSFASKLNALSVYFCRSMYQVDSNLSI